MTTLAYIRVSTGRQDPDSQKLAILEYAHQKRFKIDDFITVQASTRKRLQKIEIEKIIDRLQKGDRLIVSELSRLGRSLGQILKMVELISARGIRFNAIKEGISISGRQDMQTKVMIALFGLFAEVERDLISERTKEGLAAARAKGKILGRPKGTIGRSMLDGREDEIKLLLSKTVSKASIAKIMDCSRGALYSFIGTRKLGPGPPPRRSRSRYRKPAKNP